MAEIKLQINQVTGLEEATAPWIIGETPGGTINGSNTVFTTANAMVTSSESIFKNGLLLRRTTDYTPSAYGFTMGVAPTGGDWLRINYQRDVTPPPMGYRYIRLQITDVQLIDTGSYFAEIAKFEIRESVGGSDTASGKTYSGSTDYEYGGSFPKANAFDANAATFWRSSYDEGVSNTVRNLIVDYGVGNTVAPAQFMLQAGPFSNAGSHHYPKNFTFAGSQDNSSWTTLKTVTNEAAASNGETRTYNV